MRYWLLTSTTYGAWLPGDRRGSVTSVRERRVGDLDTGVRREHDTPGLPWEDEMPGLCASAEAAMRGGRVSLTREHADVLLAQFLETTEHRGWTLQAVAVMANHFHVIIACDGDPDPGKLIGDLKAYGSRALSLRFGRPESGAWWTKRGSKRKLPNLEAVADATHYVLHKQPNPLLTWPSQAAGEPSA